MTNDFRHIHFLGICGTAMSSVAAALAERGFTVSDFRKQLGQMTFRLKCADGFH